MAELYNSISEKQVEAFPEGSKLVSAVDDNLFKYGFEDDITPLDQYNLNLLIRAIKENLARINNNKSNSDTEIDNIKQNYLSVDKFDSFFNSEEPVVISSPVTFNGTVDAHTPVTSTPNTSTAVATVKYVHDVLDNLVLCVDGGTAADVNTINWPKNKLKA